MNENMTHYVEPEAKKIPQKQDESDGLDQNDFEYCVRLLGAIVNLGRCLEVLYMLQDHCISEEDAQKRITTIIEELE